MKQLKVGFGVMVAFLCKLGPKFLTLITKMGKSAKMVKIGLAGSSVAAYSIIFSWEFALLLMVFLFVHENGHVWAMRRAGMKVKGIYYLPLLGAAAVGDSYFPNRQSEAHIAIMGPMWGLALCVVTLIIWMITLNPFWAAITAWMSLINLINLLPVNPLDGGRVLKSLVFSLSNNLGKIITIIMGIIALIAFIKFGIYLFAFLVPIGVLEAFGEAHRYKNGKDMAAIKHRSKVLSVVLRETKKKRLDVLFDRRKKIQLAFQAIQCPLVQFLALNADMYMERPTMCGDETEAFEKKLKKENEEIQKADKEYEDEVANFGKENMTFVQMGLTTVAYFALIFIFLAFSAMLVGIPGATEAFEMLT